MYECKSKQHDDMFYLNKIRCTGSVLKYMNLTMIVALLKENRKSKREDIEGICKEKSIMLDHDIINE